VSSDADVAAAEAAMGEVTIKAGDGGGGQGVEGGGFVQVRYTLLLLSLSFHPSSCVPAFSLRSEKTRKMPEEATK